MTQNVAAGTVDVRAEVVGEGPPIVFLHGLGLRGSYWERVRARLGSGYTTILPDLRGAGETRETVREELSLRRWADDLHGLLAVLEVERPVIVGHSLGAAVALKYAIEHPGSVRALALIGADATLSNLAERMLANAERIESMGMPAWVDEFWSKNPPLSATSIERDPGALAEYRELLLSNDPVDYVRWCRAIATAEDLSGRLGEIQAPALVLIGEADDRTTPEHGRALAARLPDSRVVSFPDAGHTLPLEAADETAAALRAFLREIGVNPRVGVLRADTTPRNPREGPFGHLDVRWIVGPDTGASLISFGQSTYPKGATHENHYHPNAEEVVIGISGRGVQIVGADALEIGPGDVCFIPRNTPHRVTGTSDEGLVIYWAFGGGASIEQAGYVPLPDDAKEPL